MWKSVPWKSEWMLAFYGVQRAFFKAHCNKEPHVMHFNMSGLLDYSSLETLKTHFHCDPIYDLLWVIPREKLVQNFIYTNTKSWIIQSIHFFFFEKKNGVKEQRKWLWWNERIRHLFGLFSIACTCVLISHYLHWGFPEKSQGNEILRAGSNHDFQILHHHPHHPAKCSV